MSHGEFLKRFVSSGSRRECSRGGGEGEGVVVQGGRTYWDYKTARRQCGWREPVPGERKAIDNVAIIDDSTQLDASWLVCARMTTTTVTATTTVVRNDDAEFVSCWK